MYPDTQEQPITKKIILHVGAPKTGSTFLQRDVFPNIPGIYYVKSGDPIREFVRRLVLENPLHLDIEAEKQKITEFLATLEADTVLVSVESLFGHYYSSYYNNRYMTDVLKYIFPHAWVFASVRRQDEWLESLYHQVLHTGNPLKINTFLNYEGGDFQPFLPRYGLRGTLDVKLNFYPFVRNYHNLFGADKVLILPYEMMKEDRDDYLRRFFEFFNLQPYYPPHNTVHNRSFSKFSAYIVLAVSHLLQTDKQRRAFCKFLQNRLDNWIYIPHQFIDAKKRQQIMSFHSEGNRLLGQVCNLDLAPYGYY